MLFRRRHSLTAIAVILLCNLAQGGLQWNQFRGPNGKGTAPDARIPVHFGPEENLLWRIAVPAGHSSPVVGGRCIFLTAAERANPKELIALALDREDGKVLWRRVVQAETRGRFHPLNNPASSTPVADEKHVYVYFGTYGLLCYDHAGNEVWQRRIDTPRSKYGPATSPILYEDKVIVASVPGVVTVIQVGDELKILAHNKFEEQIYATPAVAENRLYLRTVSHLYALGE